MELTLLLPWFPILLAVGIGARLLGRAKGLYLGIACALFWIVLVQAAAGYGVWRDPWTVGALAAGAMAIAAMGAWAAQPTGEGLGTTSDAGSHAASATEPPVVQEACATGVVMQLADAIEQFDDWLQQYRDDDDPWSRFDEFVRSVLYQCCRATHVRPYRLLSEGEELAPLRAAEDFDHHDRRPARHGIVGYVVTSGRAYVAGDPAQGEHLTRLASESGESIRWAFAVRRGAKRLGLVTADHLDISPESNGPLLRAVERMINLFWSALDEAIRSRSAVQNDPVSGLPTRPAFLQLAEQSLRQSYAHGEPVAVVVIALEGLRELGDSGRWEVADDLVREFSRILRTKVRLDDRLGRFDGSRFIVLLRRVDSELAGLIVSQLILRLSTLCEDCDRWRAAVAIRCGVAGSGTERVDLNTLVFRALSQSRRARREQTSLATDLGRSTHLVGESS